MIVAPLHVQHTDTRHTRELSRRVTDVVRDYCRENPDVSDGEVRTALSMSGPPGTSIDVARRRKVVAAAVGAAIMGAFTATANAGGNVNSQTWLLIGGILAAVGGVAFAAIRLARRD